MNSKKKKILKISLFLLIFITLTLIATFLDYNISNLLASSGLQNGEYYSHNYFGRIFEVIGEMPLYLFLMFAGAILFVNFNKIVNKSLRIITQIFACLICVGACAFGLYKMGKYLSLLHPDKLSFLHDNYLTYAIMVFMAMILCFILYFLSNRYLKDFYYKLLPFALVIIFTALASQVIVQGIKPFVGRERFRTIYYLNSHNVESQGFTKWFIFNGMSSHIASDYDVNLNVTSSFFESFPSGHTAGAGITYSLIALPLCIKTLNTKKGYAILYGISIAITGVVALSRIVIGAHYLSDVLMAGTISYLMAMLAIYLYNKFSFKILNFLKNKNIVS